MKDKLTVADMEAIKKEGVQVELCERINKYLVDEAEERAGKSTIGKCNGKQLLESPRDVYSAIYSCIMKHFE